MSPALKLSFVGSGLFLLSGFTTGVWKYRKIMTSASHRAPVYVDTAHRASLLYSFAALVIAQFVQLAPYSTPVELAAAGAPLFFFAVTIAVYVVQGYLDRTDNQFSERNFITTSGMYLLIAGEIGGFAVLFWGFLSSEIF